MNNARLLKTVPLKLEECVKGRIRGVGVTRVLGCTVHTSVKVF